MSVNESSDVVIAEVSDGFATVTINRPERRNSLTVPMMRALTAAIHAMGDEQECHAIILTGNGAFCAGVDLDALSSQTPEEVDHRGTEIYDVPQAMIRALAEVPIPTFAAIDGPAIGVGMDLALACDVRFVGTEGWMMQGWARAGLVSATGGTLLMERLAPAQLWKAIDGHPRLAGPELAKMNLAEFVDGSALVAARARAAAYATMSRQMISGYVKLSRMSWTGQLEEHLKVAAEIQLAIFREGSFRQRAATVRQPSAPAKEHGDVRPPSDH